MMTTAALSLTDLLALPAGRELDALTEMLLTSSPCGDSC